MRHLWWPGSVRSICGDNARPDEAAERSLQVHGYVPWRGKLEEYCARCVHGAEIGTTDPNGDREQPVVFGFVVSEREAWKEKERAT